MNKWKALLYLHTESEVVSNPAKSLKAQENKLKEYCQTKNIEIVGVYSDTSAANTIERPGFMELIDFVEENETDLILITEWQNIMRNGPEAKAVLARMDDASIYAEAIEKYNRTT